MCDSLPKLSHGVKTSPLIKEMDGIAVVDAAQLLDPEERKIADVPRVAEPTIKLKKTVSEFIHPPFPAYMRKIFHFKP
jgi:hypothetical protein